MSERPWVVAVHEVRRSPGVQKPMRVAAPMTGLTLSASAVPEGSDVVAELTLEAMTDGRLTATGTVVAGWEGECRRCLVMVGGRLDVTVQEVFEEAPAPEADTYALDGDRVDLEPMVRDAVLLALPLAPLCRDDCAGPDPSEHPVTVAPERTDGDGVGDRNGDGVGDEPVDPRWAPLRELKLDP